MQICEYARKETCRNVEIFGGRWYWEIQQKKTAGDSYLTTFEWIDLFGKEENVTSTSKQLNSRVRRLIPLNRNFGLLEVGTESFRVIEFDWELKEFHVGNDIFNEHSESNAWATIPNRNCSSVTAGDLNFLLSCFKSCQLCRVDTKNRQIILDGPRFVLPWESDNYSLDLHGDVISGLSRSHDTINRFDARCKIMLSQTKISGFPERPKSLSRPFITQIRDFCWTTYDQLFVCSMSVENANDRESYHSKLHCINLETGQTAVLSHKFDRCTKKIWQNPEDGNLYVKSCEIIKYARREAGQNFQPPLLKHHFYRIPLNEPESLFFTAFKNIPKPMPDFVEKLAIQRKYLPLNVY